MDKRVAFYHYRFDGTDEHSRPIPGVRIMRAVTGDELGDMIAVHQGREGVNDER